MLLAQGTRATCLPTRYGQTKEIEQKLASFDYNHTPPAGERPRRSLRRSWPRSKPATARRAGLRDACIRQGRTKCSSSTTKERLKNEVQGTRSASYSHQSHHHALTIPSIGAQGPEAPEPVQANRRGCGRKARARSKGGRARYPARLRSAQPRNG